MSHAANLHAGESQTQQVIHPDDRVRGTLSICGIRRFHLSATDPWLSGRAILVPGVAKISELLVATGYGRNVSANVLITIVLVPAIITFIVAVAIILVGLATIIVGLILIVIPAIGTPWPYGNCNLGF